MNLIYTALWLLVTMSIPAMLFLIVALLEELREGLGIFILTLFALSIVAWLIYQGVLGGALPTL